MSFVNRLNKRFVYNNQSDSDSYKSSSSEKKSSGDADLFTEDDLFKGPILKNGKVMKNLKYDPFNDNFRQVYGRQKTQNKRSSAFDESFEKLLNMDHKSALGFDGVTWLLVNFVILKLSLIISTLT